MENNYNDNWLFDEWDEEYESDNYFDDFISTKENLKDLCEKIKQHLSIIETNSDSMVVLGKCNEIRRDIDEVLEYYD